jgi:hypothetical protein
MNLTLRPKKVRLNYELGNTVNLLLSDRLTNHAKNDANVNEFRSNKNC